MLIASGKPKVDAAALIEQAAAKTDIFALPSFVMKADISVENRGKTLEGKYQLVWNGPDRWREEISVPGYSEVTFGGKGIVFVKRNADFFPVQIEQVHSTLGYGAVMLDPRWLSHISVTADETPKKFRERKVNGTKADCIEVVAPGDLVREVCIDKAQGVIVRDHPFKDMNYVPIGVKTFPRYLSYKEEGGPVVEIRVTELRSAEHLPESAFAPPVGVVSQPGCMNPLQGRSAKKVEPRYPVSARQAGMTGNVSVFARIGKDGVPRDLRVVAGVSPGLNEATVEALKSWRYEPAMCGDVPVDLETVLTLKYHLTRH